MKKLIVTALSPGIAMVIAPAAMAQVGEGKTMTLMVPYPAGGLSDAIARQIVPALGKSLRQTVVVENLGGASGGIAAQKLLQTANDGRMIFQGSPNELILSPLINPDIKFKPDQFRLITQITQNPLILLARPDHPATRRRADRALEEVGEARALRQRRRRLALSRHHRGHGKAGRLQGGAYPLQGQGADDPGPRRRPGRFRDPALFTRSRTCGRKKLRMLAWVSKAPRPVHAGVAVVRREQDA